MDKHIEVKSTPAANWRQEGKTDPHNTRYECQRVDLTMGQLTDDEIANAVFLCDHRTSFDSIVYLTAAKDRIRWLSRSNEALIAQLEAAQKERDELKMKLSDAGCLLVEWKQRVEKAENERDLLAVQLEIATERSGINFDRAQKAEAALSVAQLDATRWRALLSSPAIRILGHAGLQDDKPIDGHYCHFGMEIWSHYEPYYDNKKAGEVITRYADNMIAASLVEGNADAE
ncbi:hypothetical protein V5D84_004131 [Yersinia enterocolitica]|uniref:hypothetical protein n=1 Tax=Yersinia enterocolitica TaxID=630 RepID=UPI002F9F5B7D